MLTYMGMRIIESPHIAPLPRMTTSRAFDAIQSPELVASTQTWMREFFGTYLPVYVMEDAGCIAMHPQHVAMLRAEKLRAVAPSPQESA